MREFLLCSACVSPLSWTLENPQRLGSACQAGGGDGHVGDGHGEGEGDDDDEDEFCMGEGDHDDYGATFIIQLLILSLLLRSTSLCVARLVLSDDDDGEDDNDDDDDDNDGDDNDNNDDYNELTLVYLLSGSGKNLTRG